MKLLLRYPGALLMVFIIMVIPSAAPGQEQSRTIRETNPASLLTSVQYGWPTRYFSQKLYSNFNTAAVNLTYEKEGPYLKFWNKIKLLDSLMLEFRFLKIWGNDIPLYYDQVSQEQRDQAAREGREPTTDWDTYQIGLTPYYRLYYPINKDLRPYFELGVGLTYLFQELIEDGTRWNFSLYSGIGTDFKLFNLPLFAYFRFEHFSNGMKLWSQMGIEEKRLIGPETMVFGLGFRWPL